MNSFISQLLKCLIYILRAIKGRKNNRILKLKGKKKKKNFFLFFLHTINYLANKAKLSNFILQF